MVHVVTDKWSEMKGIWSAGKSSTYREKVKKVSSEVMRIWSTEEIEYFQWQGLENDKWCEAEEIKVGWDGMWSVYEGSEVEWGARLGEMCVTDYSIEWFTHCLVYLVLFNNGSSTLGSTRFWVLIMYMCVWFLLVISRIESCLECCMLFCVMRVIVLYLLYCNVLCCIVAHCHRA